MSYSVKPPNAFGKLGRGFGQALSEQVPKEIERQRLSSGLNQLSQQKDLTPFQKFSQLASLPGTTPQIIQSGGELLQREGIAESLQKNNTNPPKRPDFPNLPKKEETPTDASSLTTRAGIDATLGNYIPWDRNQIMQVGGELYSQNPQLYPDPQKAIEAAEKMDQQNQAINTAYQNQRLGQQNVQELVKSGLRTHADKLNVKIPENIYTKVEQKAIDSVKPKKEGGRGLTEEQSRVEYGKELDDISRNYQDLRTVGNLKWSFRSPNENMRSLKSIRHDFKKRDDLENLADSYVAENGLTYGKGYYLAYPNSDYKEVNNTLTKMPDRSSRYSEIKENGLKGLLKYGLEDKDQIALKYSEKLAPLMVKEGASPLAIAEEFKAKGLDPDIWLNYLGKNRDKLKLAERQGRELSKPRNFLPNLSDNWLFLQSGLDKLVEQ